MALWSNDNAGPFCEPWALEAEKKLFLPIYSEINELILDLEDNRDGKYFTKAQFFCILFMQLFFRMDYLISKARLDLDQLPSDSKNHGCLGIVAKYGQKDGEEGHFYFGRSEQWDYFCLNQWSLLRYCVEAKEEVHVFQDFKKMEEHVFTVDLDSHLMAATEANLVQFFGPQHKYLAVGHKLLRYLSSRDILMDLMIEVFRSFYHFVWSGDNHEGEWVEQINGGLGFSVEEPLPLFWAGLWVPEEFSKKEYPYFEEPAWQGMMSLICENNEDLLNQQKPWKGNCNLYFMDLRAHRDKSFLETLFLTSRLDLISSYLEVVRNYWPDESAS